MSEGVVPSETAQRVRNDIERINDGPQQQYESIDRSQHELANLGPVISLTMVRFCRFKTDIVTLTKCRASAAFSI
eukprot:scaffold13288_cov47-Cyclotella_meneghiniana.AAC.5